MILLYYYYCQENIYIVTITVIFLVELLLYDIT